ncbi:MAG: PLDc_N domain-containing protein [Actinobacteria bacterium]|jgi:NADH:ubiquinone oxidoreductase subunit 6 (subunit J)|nr:PLDc_N domain-containing protein [Actinomycetota bacterium]NDH12522.1 PLDc_N domain-containing protein [Actinomycetota bacterium]TRZ85270.1 MAG: PLDc_N domain-containing protein [Streptomycetaceae bacterium]
MRYLPVILIFAFTIYTLADCARTPQELIRNLPKWAWVLIILLIGTIGAVAWYVAGRPKRPRNGGGFKKGKMIPPDDNPDFLRGL